MVLPAGVLLAPLLPGLLGATAVLVHRFGLRPPAWSLLLAPLLFVPVGCTEATSCAGCQCCVLSVVGQGYGLNELGCLLGSCSLCGAPSLACAHRAIVGNLVLFAAALALTWHSARFEPLPDEDLHRSP